MCYGTQIKGRQKKKEPAKTQCFCGFSVARLKGLEPLTYWFVARKQCFFCTNTAKGRA